MNGLSIGIMDSGIGGLSVHSHIKALLPEERLIYVADTAYCPYGTRPVEEIIRRCDLITRFLLKNGAKIIVLACNTATAAAIDTLRIRYPHTLIVGMEPAIKPAVLHTKSGIVGVLATHGTFMGSLYNRTLATFAGDVKVLEKVGEGWVEAVERGELKSKKTEELVRKTIVPMLEAGADHLVLGCTHYPFLIPVILKIAGPGVTIVDPAPAVARRVKQLLNENGLVAEKGTLLSEDIYYTSCEDTSVLPRAVPNAAKGGIINWRPYTFENME